MSRPFRWIAGILFIAQSAFAYTLTTAPSGQPIRWRYGQKLFLAGNFQGKDKLSPDFFYQSVVNGLQQWKWASGSQFDFEYWQGNDAKIYDASLKQNGLSSIFFASNSAEASDPNIIGFTQVWYNNDSGDLIETDIMLNDRHYELTDQVSDTSAGTVPWGARPKVYLGNIITHELGHAIGLSHSGNINASMLYIEYPEQSKLGCDDRAAARHL
ncbi:MAG: matrixin family metalloprotease, partial [Bdellovibrionales bacterium]|nr:matrixin family metalloprotease [Oligoflexia bacterium]